MLPKIFRNLIETIFHLASTKILACPPSDKRRLSLGSCNPKMIMSYWLVECDSYDRGQHGRRGQDHHEYGGVTEVAFSAPGSGRKNKASTSGGGHRSIRSADPPDGHVGSTGRSNWTCASELRATIQSGDEWEAQGPHFKAVSEMLHGFWADLSQREPLGRGRDPVFG